ncbi:4'-phosphopantetheinyl transferase superfamily protein [Magnetospirillum aberrantis SpK]|uniref:4'-phosphopantetheinyl transferase superfamily protein n=2 Tax=Magnetospirillum TaxID=13134 RepID=A0A7C9QU67_9PROT|nr:4'-phosphopantetheinyl transferase superfamily protein [Magnetospirillum aberrantis SpK]
MAVEAVEDSRWPRLFALLDDSERHRAGRMGDEGQRRTYVAAHALGRGLLSHWAGQAPQHWRFVAGEHGKPEVVTTVGQPRLRLNLSHTRGLVAAALTLDHDIGIDVEWLDRKAAGMAVARRFFAADECRQLEQLEPERQDEAFLWFWTLKEAYVKAIGKGLAQPLASFAFTLEPLSIRFDHVPAVEAGRWHFYRFRPAARHVMALAVAGDVAVKIVGQDADGLARVGGGPDYFPMGAPAVRP